MFTSLGVAIASNLSSVYVDQTGNNHPPPPPPKEESGPRSGNGRAAGGLAEYSATVLGLRKWQSMVGRLLTWESRKGRIGWARLSY
jgi:hypothetical protein